MASAKRHRANKVLITIIVLLILIIVASVAGAIVVNKYKITTIYVEGNTHYTDQEITDRVLKSKLDYNSIILSIKCKRGETFDIPFVQMLDIKILSQNTIKIIVYEKSVAGYVEYLGRYMYFDKDGIVVESASEKTSGIPLVSGLAFNSVSLYEKLPVENDEVFQTILDITKLLSKYKLTAERIFFEGNADMTLYFGEVRVQIGNGNYIDEKITRLAEILPQLEGKKGVLDMQNYQDESDTVTFVTDIQ